MKTKEFIKILLDRNYGVEIWENNDIYIRNTGGADLAYVSGEHRGEFTIGVNADNVTNEEERMWLVDFISRYSKTPTEDRELAFKKVKAKDFLKAGELYRSFLIMLATQKGHRRHYTKKCLVAMLEFQRDCIGKLESDLRRCRVDNLEGSNDDDSGADV